jgi:hypothetical protein
VPKKRKEEKPKEYTHRQLSHFKKQKRRQRVIFFTGIAVIAVVVLLPLAGWLSSDYYPLHRTVLEVNGTKFNVREYVDTMKIIRQSQSSADASTIANNALQSMEQGAIIKMGAASLNITLSDSEVISYLKSLKVPQTRSYMDFYRSQLLIQKLEANYFGPQVPQTADQVHPLMTMLESDQQAAEIRQRIVNGDNFTQLAETYGQDYYSKNVNQGDFGLHVRDVLKDQVSSAIPLDYAFSADVGSLSPPLTDNETSKQSGYWLLKIVDRPSSDNVDVQALFVSDNVVATNVRAQLVAGGSLADLADQYTQYSLSKETHGNLGFISESENTTYTTVFNSYVFDPDSPVGVWSQPIHDSELWTTGGSWLVKVLEKKINAPISDEDKNYIVQKALQDWYSQLASDPNLKVNNDLTYEIQTWAINRLEKEMPAAQVTPS